ncbi:unnamed protein product [Candidula unifasciata]|uniref:Uncharacterized protein n=1 Tax=Candidula unifasciata TaxID=100452 RepID=A0A8S4A500_9EUPU|nr:unnamed protein product [Candidula unifasciata]
MTFQSQKFNRSKDPFSVQPLPKSFYHPSPTKEVNEREVIRSPQRHSTPTTKCAEVEEFLRQNPTFHTSALPKVRTLHDLEKPGPSLLKQKDVTDSSELDEIWLDTERLNSFSTTSVPEETEPESPYVNDDGVKGLGKLKYQSGCVDGMDSKISDKTSDVDREESVLQRYVERFRNSAPKSREERMKEKSDKLHFWWLQSSSDRGNNSVDDDSKGNNLRLHPHLTEARPQSQKLTKDALLAMDEETFHLQSKADRLLSKSELSLTSSSPIVSTEGLGSSTSVSSCSVSDGHLPYQPAYFRAQARLFTNTEDKSRSLHTASRSPADDILTRWRLQRKVEEASAAVSGGQCGKLTSTKPSRNTELDVRLEEFRRKILSQKALVTQQDILFERQKLSLLMDDVKQNEGTPNRGTPQADNGADGEEPVRDVILEKLQRITRSQDYRPAETEASSRKINQIMTVSTFAVSTRDRDFSINNANFVNSKYGRNVELSVADPALNRNNTALFSQNVRQDCNVNDDGQPEVVVDSFGSQVVFDPNEKHFLLENSGTESKKSSIQSLNADDTKELKSYEKKVYAEEFCQKEAIFTGNFHNEERATRNVKYNKDTRSNHTDSSEACQQINEKMSENLYQYLEAEKPISESRLHVQKGNKTGKVIMSDDSPLHAEEEQQQNSTLQKMANSIKQTDQREEVFEGRECAREQKKRKGRHKHQVKKGRDKDNGDVNERDVLVDITNERNEGSSDIFTVKGHPGNLISYENKEGNDSFGRLDKKSRPVMNSTASPRRYCVSQRPSPLAHQPVQHAIGQAIADHFFDGSALASSVDSWASAFPQSPVLSHSINGSDYSEASPAPSQRDSTPLESTPQLHGTSDQQASSDDEYTSDAEFQEDPLLKILRHQRDHYLHQLTLIEKKLQDMEI